jgi:hypothetical protein
MVTYRLFLDQADVCSCALKRASNPTEHTALWYLRELWRALAVDGRSLPDLPDQVEVLIDIQDSGADTALTQTHTGTPSSMPALAGHATLIPGPCDSWAAAILRTAARGNLSQDQVDARRPHNFFGSG